MTDLEFLAAIKDDVISDMKETKILASLTASQAFLESNKGNSKLSQSPNNNLFGMKGSYNGQYVIMPTKEYKNGQYITIEAKFRKYPSWRESIKDHSDLFLKMTRYKNLIGETDYIRACFNVQEDGYATSPTYAKALSQSLKNTNYMNGIKQILNRSILILHLPLMFLHTELLTENSDRGMKCGKILYMN